MSRAVHTAWHRGYQCLLTATDTGWTVWVAGSPILYDMVHCDFQPAFAYVDLLNAASGGLLPRNTRGGK